MENTTRSDMEKISFDPRDTTVRRRIRRRRWQGMTAGVLVLATVTAGTALWSNAGPSGGTPRPTPALCEPGQTDTFWTTAPETNERECLGVTDRYWFHDDRLKKVTDVIADENAQAASQGAFFSIVFLANLTEQNEPRMLHRLEGVAVAQYRLNHQSEGTDKLVGAGQSPPLKVLLGNRGTDNPEEYGRLVELIKARKGTDNIVGVVGVGLSRTTTLDLTRRLSEVGLPIIGDILTGDQLNQTQGGVPGLGRVNPKVADQVAALAAYLRAQPGASSQTGMLVRLDDPNDLYASSLADGFTKRLGAYLRGRDRVYPRGPEEKGSWDAISRNLCHIPKPPDLVFYAGRAADLGSFVDYLRNRDCHPDPITVVTGSDAVRLIAELGTESPGGRDLKPVTVLFTPLAVPSVLLGEPDTAEGFTRMRDAFIDQGFEPSDLDDGWAIMAHDAVLFTTALARNPSAKGRPSPDRVRGLLYELFSEKGLPGASGDIRVNQDGDRVVTRLPILEINLDPNYKLRFLAFQKI
jgi:hypothetical protein